MVLFNSIFMTELYTKKVQAHFLNPHNFGSVKDLKGKGTIGLGETGNMKCGDVMKLAILVDKNEKIKDIKFQTFGCAAAIATSSVLTDLAKGKTIQAAKKISNKDVVKELSGLPTLKLHCSVLAESALRKAILNYEQNRKNGL